MEVIRQFIDAKKIMSIIPLPKAMQNKRLEIIVLPAEESKQEQKNKIQIESIVDSLIGVIPDEGITLEDYRAERLNKYESID